MNSFAWLIDLFFVIGRLLVYTLLNFLKLKILLSRFLLPWLWQTLLIFRANFARRLISFLKNFHVFLNSLRQLAVLLLQIDNNVAKKGGVTKQGLFDHVLGLDKLAFLPTFFQLCEAHCFHSIRGEYSGWVYNRVFIKKVK